jgi:hypothetical protein
VHRNVHSLWSSSGLRSLNLFTEKLLFLADKWSSKNFCQIKPLSITWYNWGCLILLSTVRIWFQGEAPRTSYKISISLKHSKAMMFVEFPLLRQVLQILRPTLPPSTEVFLSKSLWFRIFPACWGELLAVDYHSMGSLYRSITIWFSTWPPLGPPLSQFFYHYDGVSFSLSASGLIRSFSLAYKLTISRKFTPFVPIFQHCYSSLFR